MTIQEFLLNPTHEVRIIDKKHKRFIVYDDEILKAMAKNPDDYEIQERIIIGKGAFFG